MTPTEAGFDGAKGYRSPRKDCPDFRILLKRGKIRPSSCPTGDFKEQLVWFYPDDQPAQLLWCNADDQWFELSFTPIEKP